MKKVLIILSILVILVLVGCSKNSECNDRCMTMKEQLRQAGMTAEWGIIVGGECREVSVYSKIEQQGSVVPSGKCGANKYCDCKLDSGKFMSEDETSLAKITANKGS